MNSDFSRAEIVVSGLVQGVGFRYFVLREAEKLDLNGYVKNLYTGDVYAVAEGAKYKLEELFDKMKIGPMHSNVRGVNIKWASPQNEFTGFEIRH